MFFRIIFIISMLSIFSNNVHAQTAPELGILWQKEYQGIDLQCAKFSHDGQLIYFASDTRIGMLNAETGELLPGFDLIMDFAAEDLNITEDGKLLAVTTGSSTTYILNTVTKELVKEFSEKTLPSVKIIYHSDISPDGNFLYLSLLGEDNYYYILIYSLQEDKEIKRLITEGHVSKIKTSHDGKYFAAGISYKDLYQKWYNKLILWETGTWKEAAVLEDVEGRLEGYRYIKFSSNDQLISCVRTNNTTGKRMVSIYNFNTKQFVKTTDSTRTCSNLLFLPDNLHILLTFYDLITNERTIELHDIDKKIKEYKIPYIGNLEVYDYNGYWRIFCTLWPTIAMLTNKPNTVIETNPDNNINMVCENDKIILETILLNSPQINITITDIIGKTVYQEKKSTIQGNSRYTIDLQLSSGIYLVKVISGSKNYTFKLDVER